jgi:hypothetical protein
MLFSVMQVFCKWPLGRGWGCAVQEASACLQLRASEQGRHHEKPLPWKARNAGEKLWYTESYGF